MDLQSQPDVRRAQKVKGNGRVPFGRLRKSHSPSPGIGIRSESHIYMTLIAQHGLVCSYSDRYVFNRCVSGGTMKLCSDRPNGLLFACGILASLWVGIGAYLRECLESVTPK